MCDHSAILNHLFNSWVESAAFTETRARNADREAQGGEAKRQEEEEQRERNTNDREKNDKSYTKKPAPGPSYPGRVQFQPSQKCENTSRIYPLLLVIQNIKKEAAVSLARAAPSCEGNTVPLHLA
ncbi:hypothetical protein Anapl_04304 [Anas platyrhynchos]|uniref:Uncharacterized protein n=1 Tax=Anas platyrhynchos TaxID=8839 RepID=R0KTG5_ANAPL|nr:hypothetical protein Anapl_04304 [Anas platyrhynchos]